MFTNTFLNVSPRQRILAKLTQLQIVLWTGILFMLVQTPILYAQCPPGSPNCTDITIISNPEPSGAGQIATLFGTFDIWGPYNLKGNVKWYVDGVFLTEKKVEVNDSGQNMSWKSTIQHAFANPGPGNKTFVIKCEYVGTEQYDTNDVPQGGPIVAKSGNYLHVVSPDPNGGGGPPAGLTWNATTTVSGLTNNTIVFGEPLTIKTEWHAADFDQTPLNGFINFRNGVNGPILFNPLLYNHGEDYSATESTNTLKLGNYQIVPEYLGTEGHLQNITTPSFTVIAPKLQTNISIEPNRVITTLGQPVQLRMGVSTLAAFNGAKPTGNVKITSEGTYPFSQTSALDSDSDVHANIEPPAPGNYVFKASYEGNATFQTASAEETVTVIPVAPQTADGSPPQTPLHFYLYTSCYGPGATGVSVNGYSLMTVQALLVTDDSKTYPTGQFNVRMNGVNIASSQLYYGKHLYNFGPFRVLPGNYVMDIDYAGDELYPAGITATTNVSITENAISNSTGLGAALQQAYGIENVTINPVTPIAGKPIFLTANLNFKGSEQSAGVPAGKMDFIVNNQLLGSVSVAGFAASYKISNGLSVGKHKVKVNFYPKGAGSVVVTHRFTLSVFTYSTITLATPTKPSVLAGGTVELVAQVYDPSGAIVPTGSVVFALGNAVIGKAPLQNGEASFQWATHKIDEDGNVIMEQIELNGQTVSAPIPLDDGSYQINALYFGSDQCALSYWTFPVDVLRPDDNATALYAASRMISMVSSMGSGTVLVNGVSSPTIPSNSNHKPHLYGVNTIGADPNQLKYTGDSNIAAVLKSEFNLDLVVARYRLEKNNKDTVPVYGELSQLLPYLGSIASLGYAGSNQPNNHEYEFQSSFFVAKNENVLFIVFRGTDGKPNKDINNDGEPGLWDFGGHYIYAHPGWGYMADTLVEGVSASAAKDGIPFLGLRSIIDANRKNSANQNRQVVFAGHSLGGALSQMAALKLAYEGRLKPGDRVYTFGAPAVGAYMTWIDEALLLLVNSNSFNSQVLPKLGVEDVSSNLESATRFRNVYAYVVSHLNNVRTIRINGDKDKIPSVPDREAKKSWDAVNPTVGVTNFLNDVVDVAEGVGNEVLNWFGIESEEESGAVPPVKRPVGFDSDSANFYFNINKDPGASPDDDFAHHSFLEYTRFGLKRLAQVNQGFYFSGGEVKKPLNIPKLPQ